MTTPDQHRIAQTQVRPAVVELWRALRPLRSVVRFMNSGAHPDDEISALLAALVFRDGMSVSYACSTRGEGGQNDIGTEAGADLGALRTAEMEAAAEVLDMRLYWLSEGPEDSIRDFGFSKSGEETLQQWGRDRTLGRFVNILRKDRPDILCPTFLDVPGQHGHHRAMTSLAFDAVEAAADPNFEGSTLPLWQVSKLYLPAWSGAGQAYDDDEPPPPATLTVRGDGADPVTGWTWALIGEQSRAFHRTQAMGRWDSAARVRDWPLHLAMRTVDARDTRLTAGLPATLGELAGQEGMAPLAHDLASAQTAIDRALNAFPDFDQVANAIIDATAHLRKAQAVCPPAHRHRLDDKEAQLARAARISLRIGADARASQVFLPRDTSCSITKETNIGSADSLSANLSVPAGWKNGGGEVRVTESAPATDGYRSSWDPLAPPFPALTLRFTARGTAFRTRLPLGVAPVPLPTRSADLSQTRAVLNLATDRRRITVKLSGVYPSYGDPAFELPSGWTARIDGSDATITAPETVGAGLYQLPLLIDGQPAESFRRISYDHIAPTARTTPTVLSVRVLDAKLPSARVGYVGGGNDRVCHWLTELGIEVQDLSDDMLDQSALADHDTLVVGIFAMKFRPGLVDALPAIHDWTRAGGRLVTLYHRPWDNWDPDKTPPARLEIGQPSLRWRVTDQAAEVTHLEPDHPCLTVPNRIGPADWDGWDKERGLYFAKDWDSAYTPLLSMGDPDEDPLTGSLLAAKIGAGAHVHTSLILHHQMEHLVPGAFRLMANLVAAGG